MTHANLHSANLQPGDHLIQIESQTFGRRSFITEYRVNRVLARTLVLNAVREDGTLSETELRVSIDVNGVVTDKVSGTKGWDRRIRLYRPDDSAVGVSRAQNEVEDLRTKALRYVEAWFRSSYDRDKADAAMDALDDYTTAARNFDSLYGAEL